MFTQTKIALPRSATKQLLFAAAAATMFVAISPAFANPALEAEWDYAGWRDAQAAAAQAARVSHQTVTRNGHVVIYRSNQVGR